jgi:hypothetical protein
MAVQFQDKALFLTKHRSLYYNEMQQNVPAWRIPFMDKSITIIDALEKAFSSLRHHYAENWIVTGDQPEGRSSAAFTRLMIISAK